MWIHTVPTLSHCRGFNFQEQKTVQVQWEQRELPQAHSSPSVEHSSNPPQNGDIITKYPAMTTHHIKKGLQWSQNILLFKMTSKYWNHHYFLTYCIWQLDNEAAFTRRIRIGYKGLASIEAASLCHPYSAPTHNQTHISLPCCSLLHKLIQSLLISVCRPFHRGGLCIYVCTVCTLAAAIRWPFKGHCHTYSTYLHMYNTNKYHHGWAARWLSL